MEDYGVDRHRFLDDDDNSNSNPENNLWLVEVSG